MKKTLIVLMSVLLAAMLVVSCDDNNGSSALHKVTFDHDNEDALVVKEVKDGETVAEPAAPTKSGNVFEYWALNGDKFKFNTAITKDITLTAVWTALPKVTSETKTVTLGKVTWKVLSFEAEANRALLISDGIVDDLAFDATTNKYENSSIRAYLNGDFISTYGLSTSYMVKVDVTSNIEETQIIDSGKDYVFLLSKTEANNTNYFATAADRKSSKTWWLRSPSDETDGNSLKFAHTIAVGDGSITMDSVHTKWGIRPAFWYTWN